MAYIDGNEVLFSAEMHVEGSLIEVVQETGTSENAVMSQKASSNVFANAVKATASGAKVTLEDISPLTHTLKVQLRSETITDFSGLTLKRYGATESEFFETYMANADGTVNGVTSLYPTMTLEAPDAVTVEAEYNRDLQGALDGKLDIPKNKSGLDEMILVRWDNSIADRQVSSEPYVYSMPIRDGSGCAKFNTPTDPKHAANKQYVDNSVNAVAKGSKRTFIDWKKDIESQYEYDEEYDEAYRGTYQFGAGLYDVYLYSGSDHALAIATFEPFTNLNNDFDSTDFNLSQIVLTGDVGSVDVYICEDMDYYSYPVMEFITTGEGDEHFLLDIEELKIDTVVTLFIRVTHIVNGEEIKGGGVEVVKSTGTSDEAVMSQKAVTDALTALEGTIDPLADRVGTLESNQVTVANELGFSSTSAISQQAVTKAINESGGGSFVEGYNYSAKEFLVNLTSTAFSQVIDSVNYNNCVFHANGVYVNSLASTQTIAGVVEAHANNKTFYVSAVASARFEAEKASFTAYLAVYFKETTIATNATVDCIASR